MCFTSKPGGQNVPCSGWKGEDVCPNLVHTSLHPLPELAHHWGPKPGPGAISARVAADRVGVRAYVGEWAPCCWGRTHPGPGGCRGARRLRPGP